MGKGTNNGKTKKSNNFKPYDPSNSFVKRVTNKVSELLPQPSSWISKWLSATPQPQTEHEEDDEEQVCPPTKKIRLSPQINDYTHQNNVRLLDDQSGVTEGEISPIVHAHGSDDAVAGPSGLHVRHSDHFVSSTPAIQQHSPPLVKINGDDGSDSSDSTSGCSSLVPQADKTSTSFTNRRPQSESPSFVLSPSISLKNSKSLFSKPKYPRVEFSVTSNKGSPMFDSSAVLQSPSYRNTSANTSAKEEMEHASPFYRGRTIYGGASSWQDTLGNPSVSSGLDSTRVISVRPSASRQERVVHSDTMGTTARKILDALEKFSTPVLDAKRIPIKPNVKSTKRKLPHPYQELSIPQLPDLLRIKRRETLQSAVASRSSAATSNAGLPETSAKDIVYALRVDEKDNQKPARSLKCKGNDDFDTLPAEQVNLPNISLPVTSLPVINIGLPKPPQPKSKSPPAIQVVAPSKPTQAPSSDRQFNFKFSNPIPVSSKPISVSSIPPTISFSEPLEPNKVVPTKKGSRSEGAATNREQTVSAPAKTDPAPPTITFMNTGNKNFKLKRKTSFKEVEEEPVSVGIKAAVELKTGSVMDFFNKKDSVDAAQEQPSSSVQCTDCNDKDKAQCTSCNGGTQESGFGNRFKLTSDKWECNECLVRNSKSDEKCAACGCSKDAPPKQNNVLKPTAGFGESFKPPKDTWECTECLVRNKAESDSCVACTSPRPGTAPKPALGLGALFKKPEGTWECAECLVHNKAGTDQCVACTTIRPGASVSSTPSFNFGVPLQADAAPSGFTFGIPAGTDTKTVSKPAGGFVFGLNNTTAKNDLVPAATFKFGSSEKPASDTPKPMFTFGVPQEPAKTLEAEKTVSSSQGPSVSTPLNANAFTSLPNSIFTPSTANDTLKSIINSNTEEKEDRPSKKRVSFGDPLVEEKKIPSEVISVGGFSFGNSTSNPEPSKINFNKPMLFGANNICSGNSVSAPSMFNFSAPSVSCGVSTSASTAKAGAPPTDTPKTSAPILSFTSNNTTSSFSALEKKDNPLFGFMSDKPKLFGAPAASPFNSVPATTEPKPIGFELNASSEIKPVLPNAGATNELNSNVFGGNPEKKSMFSMGSSDEKKTNFFGSSNTANENKPSFFNNPLTNDNKNVFGAPQSESWGSKPVFSSAGETGVFGAPAATTASGFSGFGASTVPFTNTTENNQAPAFTFNAMQGQQNNPPVYFKAEQDNKQAGFAFTAPATTQGSTPFPFLGQAAPTPAPVAPGFQQQQPAFGAPAVPPNPAPAMFAPTFGNPAPSGHFTFGASQPEQQPPSMFTFNAPQGAPAAGGSASSFTFGSQNATGGAPPPPPSFDPNIKPSFNFTGGATPSFSATPTGDMPSVKLGERKIRRAVRRTPHK